MLRYCSVCAEKGVCFFGFGSGRADAQALQQYFIVHFCPAKNEPKSRRPVLMPCRSSAHSANPYKLNPCAARVLDSARITAPLAPPQNFAKNVNGHLRRAGDTICLHARHFSVVDFIRSARRLSLVMGSVHVCCHLAAKIFNCQFLTSLRRCLQEWRSATSLRSILKFRRERYRDRP